MQNPKIQPSVRRVILAGASALALAVPTAAWAQCATGADGICTITNNTAGATVTATGPTTIINNAPGVTIVQAPPAQFVPDYLFIKNSSGASIDGITLSGQRFPPVTGPSGVTIQNSGTINGNLIFAAGGTYVNDGGTITGNLSGSDSFTTETFINRSSTGTGVAGTIDPGMGVDVFIQSMASSGTYSAPATLPTHFEISGVEALGAATTITVVNRVAGQADNGLALWGNGSIVNEATLNNFSFAGSGIPPEFFIATRAVSYGGEVGKTGLIFVPRPTILQAIGYGGALTSFTNNGIINGDLALSTATFINHNAINLASNQAGTIIMAAADRDFSFTNDGDVTMVNTGVRIDNLTNAAISLATAPDASTLNAVMIGNSGEIEGGLAFDGLASNFTFNNSGTVSIGDNPNGIDRAVELELDSFQFALNPALQGDIAADSVILTNSATGRLDGGIDFSGATKTFAFTNNGAITRDAGDPYAEAVGIEVRRADVPGTEDEIDAQSVSFVNSGTIGGTVTLDQTESTLITFENSGTITRDLKSGQGLFANGADGVEIQQETVLGSTLNFSNSGTISTADYAGTAVGLEVEAGDVGSGNPQALTANAQVNFVNSGTIRASGGSYVTPGFFLGRPNETLVDFAAGVVIDVDAEGVSGVSITNAAGAVINARGPLHVGFPGSNQLVANQPPNASGLAVVARADTVSIINNGTILGGPNGVEQSGRLTAPDGTFIVAMNNQNLDFEGVIGSAIDTFESTDTVLNSETGIIEGGIALRSGDDTLSNYGIIRGNISFGAGDDRFVQGVRATLTGIANGGAGTDTALIDITGGGTINQAIYDQFVNFETVGLTGTGTVVSDVEVVVDGGELALEEGSVIDRPGEIAISGNASEGDAITNAGIIRGDVALGGGDNALTNEGEIEGDVTTGSGGDQLANNGTITGDVDLGDGDDSFTNNGTITGDVDLAGGSDTVNGSAIGEIGGTLFGGDDEGMDNVNLNLAPPVQAAVARSFAALSTLAATDTVLDLALFDHLDGFEQVTVTGPGTVEASGDLPVGVIVLAGADLHVASGASLGTTGPNVIIGSDGVENIVADGAIDGGINLGDGADSVTLGATGALAGPVDLGAGDDRFILRGGAVAGPVTGGAGTDIVQLAMVGTTSVPTPFSLAGFTAFERLENVSGTAAFSGTVDTGAVTVLGGRLIGLAGSTLIGNVQVASGATFGSAGSVTGNVAIASGGTLSPGASPGTMTITGNVALANDSTTLFEMTPTVSDAIVITGTLAIANGAQLSLTGTRPLTPGVSYDLITATGGITGSFAAADISKAATVLGYISQSAHAIQLMGTFQLTAGANPQVVATNTYLNSLLISGTASTGLLAGVPELVGADGFANAAALGRLHPEAYASVLQLGIENGLALAKAAQAINLVSGQSEAAGPFTFAQGVGSWRRLQADDARGTARANVRTQGIIGGIGYGNARFAIGAYVGKIDSRQNIGAIGASTDADGLVAGLAANAALGGFQISASWSIDRSKAETDRVLLNGATANDRYRLHGWAADASIGYAIPLGDGWDIRPQIGYTHIAYKRGGAQEAGAGAFNLNLAGDRQKASFVSGHLKLEGSEAATLTPWLSAGVRHQISGRTTDATAALAGAPTRFTVLGAARSKTLATVDAGITWNVTPGVALYTTVGSEFGAENTGQSANAGVRLRF